MVIREIKKIFYIVNVDNHGALVQYPKYRINEHFLRCPIFFFELLENRQNSGVRGPNHRKKGLINR